MELLIYIIILIYFALGALAFAWISRNKGRERKREIWAKFGTYFLIIHILFGSIYFGPPYFSVVALLLVAAGYMELTRVHVSRSMKSSWFFVGSMGVFTLLALPFVFFSFQDKSYLYFVFVVVSVFDAFSQISGQIIGGKRLMPSVSPKKTVSGFIGGTALAVVTALLIRGFIDATWIHALFYSISITIFALLGDLLASYYKRQYKVKDFSNLLPGHGGFLDRFDSLIPGGAAMFVINIIVL